MDHGRAKLTERDVVKIRRAMISGVSHLDLADDYPKVNPVTIWRAGTGRTWMHLMEPPSPERMPSRS